MSDIIHVGVPSSVESPWESAAGGVARDKEDATLAAIGESVERYCATIVNLPLKTRRGITATNRVDAERWCLFTSEQRSDPAFPFGNIYTDDCMYTDVFDIQTNRRLWIPHPFVALRDDYRTGVPTSSGLAAGPSSYQALLRAIEELIERDALMMTWLHGIAARAIRPPSRYTKQVSALHGEVWAFDLTPAYSPFPVIAVAGGIPKRGTWRYSLGVACRETWEAALDKAYLEWNQGVLFAGIYERHVDTASIQDPANLKSFDEHAIFYTLHPDLWHTLPMFRNKDTIHPVSRRGTHMSARQALIAARNAFAAHDIHAYYRDLTTIDAEQLGIRVIRAVSPDLAPIFAHQAWPLIDKLQDKLASRYPWAVRETAFPNLMPHPLG